MALIVFGLIGWRATNDASESPAIAVEPGNVTSVPGGFRVELRARNTGGSTGAQVEIEGILSGGGADEISRVVFDYVPGHSVRQGGLFFTRHPRTGHLSLRARGYSPREGAGAANDRPPGGDPFAARERVCRTRHPEVTQAVNEAIELLRKAGMSIDDVILNKFGVSR